ncbi:MAG TPA: kelch repeat-containing protein [Thermoplasmata archaeon]|nr:kelch repeat-containing protein [Thermoplasmata archaeon]
MRRVRHPGNSRRALAEVFLVGFVVAIVLAASFSSPLTPVRRARGASPRTTTTGVLAEARALGLAGDSSGSSPAVLPATSALANGSKAGWVAVSGGTGPSPRQDAAIAYDPHDGYTVLFGGGQHRNAIDYGDTWTFSGGTWTQLSGPSPPARFGATLVYDAHDGYLVLFGGYNESTSRFLNDTWTFSGGSWTELTTPVAPSPRWLMAADYDPVSQQVVLFGGGSFPALGDTWTFSGGVWTPVSTATAPPARSDAGMAFDPVAGGSLIFGGNSFSGSFLSDTWLFSGGQWSLVRSAHSPPPSIDFGMAYDPRLPGVVVASGGVSTSSTAVITWAYERGDWQNLTGSLQSQYPLRSHQTLAWDGGDHYLLMFGGVGPSGFLGDSWVLDVLDASGGTSNPVGEAPFEVNVTANTSWGIAPITYRWTLSSGGSLNTANGTLPASSAGAFSLALQVTDGAGTDVALGPFNIVAKSPVVLAASASPTQGTAPVVVTVHADASGGGPPYSYTWSFGDSTNGTLANTTHRFSTAGHYTLVAAVVDGFNHRATQSISVVVAKSSGSSNNTNNSNQSNAPGGAGSFLGSSIPLWALLAVVAIAAAAIGVAVVLTRRPRT